MIEKLKRKFILITMASVLIVLAVVVLLLNGYNFYRIDQRADALLAVLTENNGRFPEVTVRVDFRPAQELRPEFQLALTEETPFETRYFWVRTDEQGAVSRANTNNIAAVSKNEAIQYSQTALAGGKTTGYQGLYKYRVADQADGGQLVVFVDCASQLNSWLTFLLSSLAVAAICFLAVLVLVTLLTRRALAPMIDNMERQKQFVTNAGHELKTPLAIISANTDVLELENGPSEWLTSIRSQTTRLEGLIRNLLTMAKMEEQETPLVCQVFSLSAAVMDTAASFGPLAEASGVQLALDIQPDLLLDGSEEAIRQLISILTDNAIKYAAKPSTITLRLKSRGRSGALLEVTNRCDNIPTGDLHRLFERFYRADTSRARQSGGYGIGLSVAQTIAQAHKAKLTARREDEHTICFAVSF